MALSHFRGRHWQPSALQAALQLRGVPEESRSDYGVACAMVRGRNIHGSNVIGSSAAHRVVSARGAR